MISRKSPTYTFEYEDTKSSVYHVEAGEGLPEHEHVFAHLTYCVSGRCAIRKENLYLEIHKNHEPVLLKAMQWHSIEALEPNTIFINTFPKAEM